MPEKLQKKISESKASATHQKVILILEDDPDCLQVYKELVIKLGHHAYATSDGFEALAHAADLPRLDLVLLDIDMPIMNGIRFYNEFRKIGSHRKAKTILTSSNKLAADLCVALGFFAHAPKSTSLERLQGLVSRALFD
jgi:CheY-like chemotaxis protein